MSRYPAAVWLPLAASHLPGKPITSHERINLHVAVSEALSLRPYFDTDGKPSSHFYVRRDGTVEQYVDTDERAEADLEGNASTVSIETQGGVDDPNGEPWTDEQLAALAALAAWLMDTHQIPAQLAIDSRPGESSRGLSWHRLGIDPWRVAGGLRYSSSRGKVCPGDTKIDQIPAILDHARQLLGAAPVEHPVQPPATPAPSAPPAPAGGIDVSSLPVLHRGDTGVPVKRVQGLLIADGYSVGAAGIDGSWGPSTDAGFAAFQTDHPDTGTNGQPDGSCGPKSWAKLLGL